MKHLFGKFLADMTVEGDYKTPFDYSLHFRTDGHGAEKLLLVVGFSSCGQYWGPLVDAIHHRYPGRYTTCIYDQRGVGQSTTSARHKFSSRTIARDALGMLLHLGWVGKHTPVHIVSWSMGGFGSMELINILLAELGSTLNITSLTLCNTGHKLVFPAAKALIPCLKCLGRGILSLLFNIPTKWMIPEILSLHYSRTYLEDPTVYGKLLREYETRSPFNAPMRATAFALLQHVYAVLTHYVPKERMKAIRDSGLSVHAVVSSEDLLIHPTASITLARKLGCDFSYLPGGHMSHVEHTDAVIDRLVSIWDTGLARKFPHFRKAPNGSMVRNLSMGSPVALTGGTGSPHVTADWPKGELAVQSQLRELIAGGIDNWGSFRALVKRIRQPGRLVIGPALVLPIVIIQARKILFGGKYLSKTERGFELGLLLYIFALILIVQEVTREEG